MNANYEARKEAWNQNKAELRAWIADPKSSFGTLEADVQNRLRIIIGKSGVRQSTSNVNDQIRTKFMAQGTLTNVELFTEFELGKGDMKAFIKGQLSRKDATSWMWIEYDDQAKTYTLKGTGPEVPTDYHGWVPTEMREEEL